MSSDIKVHYTYLYLSYCTFIFEKQLLHTDIVALLFSKMSKLRKFAVILSLYTQVGFTFYIPL